MCSIVFRNGTQFHEGCNMQVKTDKNGICIYMTPKEAQWIIEEFDVLDIPENGLITLNVLKDAIVIGVYQEQ